MKRWLSITVTLFAFLFLVAYMIVESASGDKRETTSGTSQSVEKTTTVNAGDLRMTTATSSGNQVPSFKDLAARSPNFNVERYSINSGGDIMAFSASFGSGVSVAQSVAGEATSASYNLDIGFWYAVAGCCIGIRGDLNGDGDDANILDLTFLIDFIFRGSGDPGTCPEESDVNGDGDSANILDLTFIVDFIFRGGPLPGSC